MVGSRSGWLRRFGLLADQADCQLRRNGVQKFPKRKPKTCIKCGDCGNRSLIPLSDAVIHDHLSGESTIGGYPLLADDTCYFVAIDSFG